MYTFRLAVLLLLLPTFSAAAIAQPANSSSSAAGANVATAARATGAPTLDGDVLGDPAWAHATPISGFTRAQPNEGQPVSERTGRPALLPNDSPSLGAL